MKLTKETRNTIREGMVIRFGNGDQYTITGVVRYRNGGIILALTDERGRTIYGYPASKCYGAEIIERLFYCHESERLWSMEELREFYNTEADKDNTLHTNFNAWLRSCLYENNGTLEEVKPTRTIYDNGKAVYTEWNIKTDLF